MNRNRLVDNVFIWIIIGASSLGMIDLLILNYEINDLSKILSIGTSLIGIIGVILYYQKKNIFAYFILFWILIQFVEISEYLINPEGIKYWKHIFISKQLIDFTIFKSFDINGAGHKIELNLLPFVYLYLYQTLRLNKFRGRKLIVFRFREKTELELETYNGIIVERLTINKEKKSFLVRLEKQIQSEDAENMSYCIISDSKSKSFGLNKPLNLKLFRLKDKIILDGKGINSLDIDYVDWIEAKIN